MELSARTLFLAAAVLAAARADGPAVAITGDVSRAGAPVPAVFSTLTHWNIADFGGQAPPADFRARYPFLTHVEFFTATGGCYAGFPGCTSDRDLFNDAAVGPASGVNASRLFAPLRNVLAAGLTPHIVTGNVPLALSAPPRALGGFGFNAAPPSSMAAYGDYIEAVASQLVAEFGAAEVSRWRWGVFTEYNNQDWLNGNASAFADLYDYTVCGLERALGGASSVDVGVHACVQCGGAHDWNPLDFLEHAATGVSACTGGRVHLNWTGNSFYEHAPGDPGDLSAWAPQGAAVLARAAELGLPAARYGIDEGRLLWGPEGPTFQLTTRAVGDAYQASWDALFFKLLVATGATDAYYARWGLSTGAAFDAADAVVDNAAANLARLAERLARGGARLVPTANASAPGAPPTRAVVDAVASAGADGVLRALVFHHWPALDASAVPAATATLALCGLGAAVPRGAVKGAVITRLDADNSMFWPLWRADAARANLSAAAGDYGAGWSEWSDDLDLGSPRARGVLAAGLARYQAAAALAAGPLAGAAVGADGCARVDVQLPPHGVALVELPGLV